MRELLPCAFLLVACNGAVEPTTITLQTVLDTPAIDDAPGTPAWLAVQDGGPESAWTVVDPATTTIEVTGERYAIAAACGELTFPPTLTVLARRATDGDLTIRCARADEVPPPQHAITGRVAGGPAFIQLFARDTALEQSFIGDPDERIVMLAHRGRHDVVAFGTTNGTIEPQQVLVQRDVDAELDPVLDLDPRTNPAYLDFGPEVTTENSAFLITSATYITANGTQVLLGDSDELTLRTPGWPAAARAAGDMYRYDATIGFLTPDVRVTQHFTSSPLARSPQSPDLMRAALAPGGVALQPISDAEAYEIQCRMVDRAITYDITAGWLGDAEQYEFPVLPEDPNVNQNSDGCTWDVSAIGGTATRADLDAIGTVPGAVGRLDGREHWVSTHTIAP